MESVLTRLIGKQKRQSSSTAAIALEASRSQKCVDDRGTSQSDPVATTKMANAPKKQRGVFPNPSGKTCHLAATLQLVFASSELVTYLRLHEGCTKGFETCMWCLLRHTELESRAPGSKFSLEFWRWWVNTFNESFEEQQDALLNMLAIVETYPHGMAMCAKYEALAGTVSLTHRTHFDVCSCRSTTEETRTVSARVMQLQLPANIQQIALADLVQHIGMFAPIDDDGYCELCCAQVRREQCTKVKAVGSVLLLEINRIREVVSNGSRRGCITKDRCSVDLPDVLVIAGKRMRLCGVLCHSGETYNAGHYMTLVRRQSEWWCYNDGDVPRSFRDTPSVALCTSRLILYETEVTSDVTLPLTTNVPLIDLNSEDELLSSFNESPAKKERVSASLARSHSGKALTASPTLPHVPELSAPSMACSVSMQFTDKLSQSKQPAAAQMSSHDSEASAPSVSLAHVVPSAPVEPESVTCTQASETRRRLMAFEFGQERLEADVRLILQLYQDKLDVRALLLSLPLFAPTPTLASLATEFDHAVQMLCRDEVNSTAALQIRPCLVETMTYPLLVLLHATAISQGIPTVFFVDSLHAVINSVLHKEFCVQMGRWKSKSRHWWVGTANVGEGKSPCMKHFVNAMVDVLKEYQPNAVGFPSDRFHFQQSGTTASAIDKLRTCDAYLAVYCSDAVRCLCPAAATGGATDAYRYIDIEMFLDAAHGDEFNHSTFRQREKAAKETLQNPLAPAKPKAPTHLDPTNVHFMFLQQEVVFATWWAQMTPKKPTGVAQRFLMSFGGDADPAPVALGGFMEEITVPVIKALFRLIVRHVGPVITGTDIPKVQCSLEQNVTLAELENIVNLHKRRHNVSETFRGALPKSMYWLGTSLLLHHTISSMWPAALRGEDIEAIPADVSNSVFGAAIRFAHLRYLAGQAVLAISVKEKVWAGREIAHVAVPGDLVPSLVRILRGTPGAFITEATILSIDLELQRDLRFQSTAAHAAATHRREELWRMLADVGIGQIKHDANGQRYMHKYDRSALTLSTIRWLQENRVPGYMSGIAMVNEANRMSSQETSLRGTNPTLTIRATTRDGFGPAPPFSTASQPVASLSSVALESYASSQPKPYSLEVISSEFIEGIFMEPKACRAYMRNKLTDLNISAEVTDIKPLRHDKYYMFKAVCLRCRDRGSAVQYRGTYYRRDLGVPAKTFIITSRGVHQHADNDASDRCRVFNPIQEKLAKAYMSANTQWSLKALQNHLMTAGYASETHPSKEQMSRWIRNHKPKVVTVDRKVTPPRAELMKRSVEEWPAQETLHADELFVQSVPRPVHDDTRVCVAFASKGMVDTMRRFADNELVICVDAKQSCMAHGWSVVTASLVVRDKLRYTTLGRRERKRVQGMAYTSHAAPVLQAIINVENIENMYQFFASLKYIWSTACPGRLKLESHVRQMHKDYHAAIENARAFHFPQARPVNDFFHLLEKSKTIETKLSVLEIAGGAHRKKEYAWVIACVHGLRHIPTVDLFSALWRGFLNRLQSKGEEMLLDYLGPKGVQRYTLLLSARTLRSMNILCQSNEDEELLLFCPHWAGITGILPGSDCGDQPQEAFHSPWQRQLKVMGADADCTAVLATMQELYREWSTQCAWSSHAPLQLMAPDVDPEYIAGTLLARVGRSTACDMSDVEHSYVVVDISEHVQVVAMSRDVKTTLNEAIARIGAQLLFQSDDALRSALRNVGALQVCTSNTGTITTDCVSLSAVLKVFHQICYVIVRKPGHDPHPHVSQPLCTCVSYCRYAGCEHVEYVKMLDLRLREATSTKNRLPELKRRGRKRGHVLTERGAAKVIAKAKSATSPKVKSKAKANAKTKTKSEGKVSTSNADM